MKYFAKHFINTDTKIVNSINNNMVNISWEGEALNLEENKEKYRVGLV